MSRHSLICSLPALIALLAVSTASADWLQFRGNFANGVAEGPTPPSSWSNDKNIAWKVDLIGRGLSSPIIVGDRVYVTAAEGFRENKLHVLCFDAATGNQLWHRHYWATGRTLCHDKMSVATPTPASDGKRIFASYSSNDVACLDLDGNLLWYRGLNYDFPNASNSLGMSSSPVVIGDTLVVMVENDAESFTTGLDVETGESRWKVDRPRAANWTSPTILSGSHGGQSAVLVQSSRGVVALETRTGSELWNYSDGAATIPSLTVDGQVAYIPSNGTTALKLPAGSENKFEQLWRNGNIGPDASSILAHDKHLYLVNGAGVLNCLSQNDGKRLWQLRLKGSFWSSPIVSGKHLYIFNENGVGQVVELAPDKGTLVSEHDFQESIMATPSISDGALYIRSDAHLWKIAAGN